MLVPELIVVYDSLAACLVSSPAISLSAMWLCLGTST